MTLKMAKVPIGSKYQLIIFNIETYKVEYLYCKTEKEMMKIREEHKDKKFKISIIKLN